MTERAALIDFVHQWGLVGDAVLWLCVLLAAVAVIGWIVWGRRDA